MSDNPSAQLNRTGHLSRRQLLQRCSVGFGAVALTGLMDALAKANELPPGTPIRADELVGPDKWLPELPQCPAGGTYEVLGYVPEKGEVYMTCSHPDHSPNNVEGW